MAIEKAEQIVAVADSSFLIGLCMIERFSLLKQMVDQIFISPIVWNEVVEKGKGRPGADELANADIVKCKKPENTESAKMLLAFLDPGEAAREAGVRYMGILGFLLAAKQKNLIESIDPIIQELLNHGFRLSEAVIEEVLQRAGELDKK